LSLEAIVDFKVASYDAIAREAGNQNAVDERLNQVPWTDSRKLSKVTINSLLPGEARDARFKNFNLRAVIDRYLKPSAGDLWPWKLRITLVATTSNGLRVAYSEAIIDLVPAD